MIIVEKIYYNEKTKLTEITFVIDNIPRIYLLDDMAFDILAKHNIETGVEIPEEIFKDIRSEHFKRQLLNSAKGMDPASLAEHHNDEID